MLLLLILRFDNPLDLEHTLQSLLEKQTNILVYHSMSVVLVLYPLKRHINHDNAATSKVRHSPTGESLTILVTSAKVVDFLLPESSNSTTSKVDMVTGLLRSSKCSFHCLAISWVQVSSFPPIPNTAQNRNQLLFSELWNGLPECPPWTLWLPQPEFLFPLWKLQSFWPFCTCHLNYRQWTVCSSSLQNTNSQMCTPNNVGHQHLLDLILK